MLQVVCLLKVYLSLNYKNILWYWKCWICNFLLLLSVSVWFYNILDCKNNSLTKEIKLYRSTMWNTTIKSITPFLTCLGFHDIIMCCKQFFYLTSDVFCLFMKAAHSLSFTIALISNMYPVRGWNNENYLRNFYLFILIIFPFLWKCNDIHDALNVLKFSKRLVGVIRTNHIRESSNIWLKMYISATIQLNFPYAWIIISPENL